MNVPQQWWNPFTFTLTFTFPMACTCVRVCMCLYNIWRSYNLNKMNNHVKWEREAESRSAFDICFKRPISTERPFFTFSRAYHLIQNDTLFLSKSTRLLTKKPDSNRFAVYSGCSSFPIANLIENQYLGSFSWGEKNTVQISSKFLIYDVFC